MKKICNKTIIELIVERVNQIEDIDKIFVLTGPKNKNLELINEKSLNQIDQINNIFKSFQNKK